MDNDFQKRLLATFRVETKEHLTAISAGLVELEQAADHARRQQLLETVFREAHSLKGAARAVNLAGIESLSHAIEGVFARIRRQERILSCPQFDTLHQAVDLIDRLLASDNGAGSGEDAGVRALVRRLEAGEGVPAPPPVALPEQEHREHHPDTPSPAGTVRITAGKLDVLLHQAEELLTVRLAARQRSVELAELETLLGTWEKVWKKVRPAVRRLRRERSGTPGRTTATERAGQMDRLIDFFDMSHDLTRSLQNAVQKLARETAGDRHALDGMITTLLDGLKEALMLPCTTVLQVLPKMVRDLARAQGKEAELAISGETVEIDKRVLDELKDPLIHLLRNCIDHGIEPPEERERRNKPARGRVEVAISIIGANRVEILVSDDGRGLDTGRLTEEAIRQGIITGGETGPGDEEAQGLVFKSGLSTAAFITDISGRGLGLAIVREKAEKLGGAVTVASMPGQGTTFRLLLPLTLSTYRGVLVRAGEQTFVVPAAAVSCVKRVDTATIRTVGNRETIELDGEAVSFVRLAPLLQLPPGRRPWDAAEFVPVFVLGSGAGRIAFGVDDILDEQEILVKSLGPQLLRVRNVSGATVLGNGEVAVILHHGDLMKSAAKGSPLPAGVAPANEERESARKSILVAEDSITSRTLLKNILETAGYRVVTAVDGMDALTRVTTEMIDLVVSDVDMPRLNGFDLTVKIRASREFPDLPVVLVTSLDSREDRERGIEAGANAYIVKSSFDQSNLLEAIKRFI